MEDIVLIGYGGHGKSVADSIFSMRKYNLKGYIDRVCYSESTLPYLGTDSVISELYDKGVRNAAVGIGFMGNSKIRDEIYKKLISIGFELPPIIDSSAVIAGNVKIDEGAFIGKNAVINSYASVGKLAIINTGSIIEHESKIDDFSHIAVGADICGNVEIGDHVFVGAGAVVIQRIAVGRCSIIGAGAVIVENVCENSTVVGIPGRRVK